MNAKKSLSLLIGLVLGTMLVFAATVPNAPVNSYTFDDYAAIYGCQQFTDNEVDAYGFEWTHDEASLWNEYVRNGCTTIPMYEPFYCQQFTHDECDGLGLGWTHDECDAWNEYVVDMCMPVPMPPPLPPAPVVPPFYCQQFTHDECDLLGLGWTPDECDAWNEYVVDMCMPVPMPPPFPPPLPPPMPIFTPWMPSYWGPFWGCEEFTHDECDLLGLGWTHDECDVWNSFVNDFCYAPMPMP